MVTEAPALPHPPRLLILGGTTEASRLAAALAGDAAVAPVLSMAGRTRDPVLPPIPVRIGGFGGVDGLTRFLRDEGIAAVVDATHPFATVMSDHAATACDRFALPRVIYTRAPWSPEPGDRWTGVPHLTAAAEALGFAPARVFLTTGRLGLAAFRAASQHHYLVRSIDPPAPTDCPPHCRILLDRGPFDIEAEAALMRREAIDVLVTKNSGGAASRAKILAARQLGSPVVMVDRPPPPHGVVLTALPAVLRWIADHLTAP